MDCHLCGRPATSECQRCQRAVCPQHLAEFCSSCTVAAGRGGQPLVLMPLAFQATVLVVVIAAALNLGLAVYAWSGLPAPFGSERAAGQEATPSPSVSATRTPTAAATPTAAPAETPAGLLGQETPRPKATFTATATVTGTIGPAATAVPQTPAATATPSSTQTPTATATRTATPILPTATRVPPTATPVPAAATPTDGAPTTYVVQPGDNLTQIGRRFGTTADAIRIANDLSADTLLQVGQRLVIPAR